MTGIKVKKVSWGVINRLALQLSHSIGIHLQEHPGSIKSIYGIPRGGLIPAVILSHLLELPLVTNYEEATTLVIDDIADSGETLSSIVNPTGVLYYKPKTSKKVPTFTGKRQLGDEWLIFPWESQGSKLIQGYKEDQL
jgi:uncharacterized protein